MQFAAIFKQHKANAQIWIMPPKSFKAAQEDVDVNKDHVAKVVTLWFVVYVNVTKVIHSASIFMA